MSSSSPSHRLEAGFGRRPQISRRLSAETEHLVASIPSLLIGLDESERVLLWNAQAELLLECRSSEVVGRQLADIELPWEDERIAAGIAACRASASPVRIEDIVCALPGREPCTPWPKARPAHWS